VFDRVILSTDDTAIADVGRAHGCEVPFMRPADLARDDTPHLPVMQHALEWLGTREGYRPDAVMILQPTAPLRRVEDVRAAVDLLARTDADSVISVSEVPAHMHPMSMLRVDEHGRAALFVSGAPVRTRPKRRQDLPPAWVINGAVYVFRTGVLFAPEPSLYGEITRILPMPHPYGLSIDTPEDWDAAVRALENHHGS
jgi:CMP-N,N'-diacetyllegionaminic acid synthase